MRKSKLFLIILLIAPIVFTLGCRKRDIATPAYIKIDRINFYTTGEEGAPSHGIEMVNVFINDNSVGIYQLPCEFPVLQTGVQKIDVRPMIKEMAREGFKLFNLTDVYDTVVTIEAQQTIQLYPEFRYVNNRELVWIEDFDDLVSSFNIRLGTLDTMIIENEPSISLDGSPYIKLDLGVGETFFEIETQDLFELPGDGRDVYLEMDYRANMQFTLGVISSSPSEVVFIPSVTPFSSNDVWRKAYIQLRDEIRNQRPDTKFKIYLRGINNQVERPLLYFDNFKLIYRAG
jgi:hypothetical protein